MNIQMVDLKLQYTRLKPEIDKAIQDCLDSTMFIGGPQVAAFQKELEQYLHTRHVVPCANGTDALQIAMMALGLKPGDEVIVPAFTYAATAEVIALLGLTPVMTDVDPDTFNITKEIAEKALTPRTKAIVPVHLFGQSSDMEPIVKWAKEHNIYVIEDNAQAIGADYTFSDGSVKKTGTMGHIGSTSFFPSKNLGCYGDGGALYTDDDAIAADLRMVANHGQRQKYYHSVVGVNSRLDAMQAGILSVKLQHLDQFAAARQQAAAHYDHAFRDVPQLRTPARQKNSTHVFHQYTLKVLDGSRDALMAHLQKLGIPSMIYYPIPLYKQDAFKQYVPEGFSLPVTEALCAQVFSLPIHTEMNPEMLDFIAGAVKAFFEK